MRAAEEAAFARGIEVEALMDQAGAGVARAVQKFFPHPGTCIVYAGKGHNGGDALVAAECLQREGWKVDDPAPISRKRLQRTDPQETCRSARCSEVDGASALRLERATARLSSGPIILDGLLGVGTKSLLREPIRATARELNRLRLERNAVVFAVDLPTGFNSDTGEIDPDSVVADFTVTIGFAKHGLIADNAIDFVGRIDSSGRCPISRREALATKSWRRPRPWPDSSRAGNSAPTRISADASRVVAGSKGFVGAALMTASGALRAGAGLVELFVPEDIYEIAAAAAPPEVMVKATRAYQGSARARRSTSGQSGPAWETRTARGSATSSPGSSNRWWSMRMG